MGVTVCLLTIATATLHSQPSLDFRRIAVDWSTITLYIQVKCGNDIQYGLTKNNFQIRENDIPIEEFEVWAPDQYRHCSFSIDIGIDRSYRASETLDLAKSHGRTMVRQMDGGSDEAAIMSWDTNVKLEAALTSDTTNLLTTIDQLQSGNGKAVWTGVIKLIEHVIVFGENECRAIILISDGNSLNDKDITVADVIDKAIQNKLRIFTIGIGDDVNQADLQQIATDTGGKFFLDPSVEQVRNIIKDIGTYLWGPIIENEIEYISTCPDGVRRNVDLTLNLCAGTDTKRKSYKASKDTTRLEQIPITLEERQAFRGERFVMPVLFHSMLTYPVSPFQFRVLYDTSFLKLRNVQLSAGIRRDSTFWNITANGVDVFVTKNSYFKS